MTCFFCHSFSWGNGNKSNAATLSINIFLYSALLAVSFLQRSGCILRLLSALAVLRSCVFWFLRPRFSGTELLVFMRRLLRIGSARVHGSRPAPERRGGNSRTSARQRRERGQPISLTSEAHSQSEGAPVCRWPMSGAVGLARGGERRCGERQGATAGAAAWGDFLGQQALSNFKSVLIAYREVGVWSREWGFSLFVLFL